MNLDQSGDRGSSLDEVKGDHAPRLNIYFTAGKVEHIFINKSSNN